MKKIDQNLNKITKQNKNNIKSPEENSVPKWYLISAIIVFVALLIVLLINDNLKKEIVNNKLFNIPFAIPSVAPYPIISSNTIIVPPINTNQESFKVVSPNLLAEAAVVIDNDSKVILFAKNEKTKFSMASTTKIMTALTALEYFKMDDVLTVQSENVDGTVVGLRKGEKFFFQDILYIMLLPSANDAALAIAENYPGGEKEFVKKMNENAHFFYLNNTFFSDSTGLDNEGDYSTPLDLARLSSLAIKNKIFAEIVSTKQKTVSNIEGTNIYPLHNLNILLGVNGVNGIKTGFTDEAKGILSTSKMENGHTLIIVVMKSQDRFADTQKLLSFVSGKISYLKLDPTFEATLP